MERMIAVFPNYELAHASYKLLHDFGISMNTVHILTKHNPNPMINNELLHRLSHGNCLLIFTTTEDHRIAANELIHSFAGELYDENNMNEVMNRMYNIPDEEAIEQADSSEVQQPVAEVGTLGYPYDLLNDDAYIDPNIGLGDHDLLNPFLQDRHYDHE